MRKKKKVKKIFGGRTTTDVVCAAQANMMILFEEKTVRIIQFAKVFFFLCKLLNTFQLCRRFL